MPEPSTPRPAKPQPAPEVDKPPFLVGHGFDIHRLAPIAPEGEGRPFVLGGVLLDHDLGPVGHSDGDALLHALTDALLGAIGGPDIGDLFPDTDAAWEGADSSVFVREAVRRVLAEGYDPTNIDATIILQRPKLGGRKPEIRKRLAELVGLPEARVAVKGKTHERVDAVGEGRAVVVHCTVGLTRSSTGS